MEIPSVVGAGLAVIGAGIGIGVALGLVFGLSG